MTTFLTTSSGRVAARMAAGPCAGASAASGPAAGISSNPRVPAATSVP